MDVTTSISALRAALVPARAQGKRIGFVPTMGYLHQGHLSLIDACRAACDLTVVSIFVNPLQFGPAEDFAAYPREEARDLALCEAHGVNAVFLPPVKEMYPPGSRTKVTVQEITTVLCGARRPGHFDGVATVCTKLFNIVQPDIAFFGQKDYQQCVVIRQLVSDLNLPMEIRVCPTVREPDGLAMSSRNVYLRPQERQAATALFRGLQAALAAFRGGIRSAAALRRAAADELAKEPLVRTDYVEVVNGRDLSPIEYVESGDVIACAAFVGKARLIDNVIFEV